MWKIILLIITLISGGCSHISNDDSYWREKKVVIYKDTKEIEIYGKMRGHGYWVPFRDVQRFITTDFIVEIEHHDKLTGVTTIVQSDNLMKPPYRDSDNPPYLLLGASSDYVFFMGHSVFFMVNIATGKIHRIPCERHYFMDDGWTAIGTDAIRLKMKGGMGYGIKDSMLEYSPIGVRIITNPYDRSSGKIAMANWNKQLLQMEIDFR